MPKAPAAPKVQCCICNVTLRCTVNDQGKGRSRLHGPHPNNQVTLYIIPSCWHDKLINIKLLTKRQCESTITVCQACKTAIEKYFTPTERILALNNTRHIKMAMEIIGWVDFRIERKNKTRWLHEMDWTHTQPLEIFKLKNCPSHDLASYPEGIADVHGILHVGHQTHFRRARKSDNDFEGCLIRYKSMKKRYEHLVRETEDLGWLVKLGRGLYEKRKRGKDSMGPYTGTYTDTDTEADTDRDGDEDDGSEETDARHYQVHIKSKRLDVAIQPPGDDYRQHKRARLDKDDKAKGKQREQEIDPDVGEDDDGDPDTSEEQQTHEPLSRNLENTMKGSQTAHTEEDRRGTRLDTDSKNKNSEESRLSDSDANVPLRTSATRGIQLPESSIVGGARYTSPPSQAMSQQQASAQSSSSALLNERPSPRKLRSNREESVYVPPVHIRRRFKELTSPLRRSARDSRQQFSSRHGEAGLGGSLTAHDSTRTPEKTPEKTASKKRRIFMSSSSEGEDEDTPTALVASPSTTAEIATTTATQVEAKRLTTGDAFVKPTSNSSTVSALRSSSSISALPRRKSNVIVEVPKRNAASRSMLAQGVDRPTFTSSSKSNIFSAIVDGSLSPPTSLSSIAETQAPPALTAPVNPHKRRRCTPTGNISVITPSRGKAAKSPESTSVVAAVLSQKAPSDLSDSKALTIPTVVSNGTSTAQHLAASDTSLAAYLTGQRCASRVPSLTESNVAASTATTMSTSSPESTATAEAAPPVDDNEILANNIPKSASLDGGSDTADMSQDDLRAKIAAQAAKAISKRWRRIEKAQRKLNRAAEREIKRAAKVAAKAAGEANAPLTETRSNEKSQSSPDEIDAEEEHDTPLASTSARESSLASENTSITPAASATPASIFTVPSTQTAGAHVVHEKNTVHPVAAKEDDEEVDELASTPDDDMGQQIEVDTPVVPIFLPLPPPRRAKKERARLFVKVEDDELYGHKLANTSEEDEDMDLDITGLVAQFASEYEAQYTRV